MNKDEKLNQYYHATLKKWLKGKCSAQADSVSNSFSDNKLLAQYDEQGDFFMIGVKKYPRVQIANTVDNEEEFNRLIMQMLQNQ